MTKKEPLMEKAERVPSAEEVEAVAQAISGDHDTTWRLRPNDKAQLRALVRGNVVLPGTPTRDDFRDDARAAIIRLDQVRGR